MAPRTWLVTGASRGLGRALVEAAARAGEPVVAAVRTPGTAPEHDLVQERVLDLRDRDSARAAVRFASEHLGRLDVVVNNAGHGLIAAVEEADEADVRELFDTAFFGAMWVTQAATTQMRAQGSGHLVQVSSVGGVGTMPTLGVYNSAKWALEALTEALAAEVAGLGIRVSIVEPGEMDTHWATASMRFGAPITAYDELREQLFGTSAVPWPPTGGTGGGTAPADIARAIRAHVDDPDDRRLRVLVGDDAPPAVAEALRRRLTDYGRDPRFALAPPDAED